MINEFFSLMFQDDHEHAGLFAEFLPEPTDEGFTITLFASAYPHFLSETLEEAKEIFEDLKKENEDLSLEIVKVSQQIDVVK